MRAGEMGFSHVGGRRPRGGGATGVSTGDGVRLKVELYDTTAPRRCAGHRALLLHRGPAADPAQDRPAGRCRYIEGGWPRREPPRHRVLQARDEGAGSSTPTLTAFGMTAARPASGPRTERGPRHCSTPAPEVTSRRKSWDPARRPRHCGPTSTRASRCAGTRIAFLRRRGSASVLRRRALLRRQCRCDARFAVCVSAGAAAGAPEPSALVLCDTNGGMLPLRRPVVA